jgi:hypothetical protein
VGHVELKVVWKRDCIDGDMKESGKEGWGIWQVKGRSVVLLFSQDHFLLPDTSFCKMREAYTILLLI